MHGPLCASFMTFGVNRKWDNIIFQCQNKDEDFFLIHNFDYVVTVLNTWYKTLITLFVHVSVKNRGCPCLCKIVKFYLLHIMFVSPLA